MELKLCIRCEKEKLVSDFGIRSNGNVRGHCKECQNEMQRENYKKNKDKRRNLNREKRNEIRKFVWEIKERSACVKCGQNHPAALVFHHRDSEEKEDSLSNAVARMWSKKRIEKEIKKCDIYCANCHRIHHYNEDEHWKVK